VPEDADGKAKAPIMHVDVEKCDYHGECAVICPFGAIKILVDGEEKFPVVEKEAFPLLIRDIEIEDEKCEPACIICEEKCPVDAITVRFQTLTSQEMEEREKKKLPETSQRTLVEVKKDLCAGCRICEAECPVGVIRVSKFFEGSLKIDQSLCPEGCQNCYDVCPVDALYLEPDGKVYVKDQFCIYCGACVNVCPKLEALELKRTSVRHTPIQSGAWNKALEVLTSTSGLKKELRNKRTVKARDAIKNLKLTKGE
jgi:4Fe-4S ferredoxin